MSKNNPEIIKRLEENVRKIIHGKTEVVRLATVAIIARGHILLEDVPGVGKTTLAQALARSMGVEFKRIQFTSDLLPTDILGLSVYNRESTAFEFRPGPIFAGVVLADEINRTTPKTQSALLEAMNEAQVTIDNITYTLPQPFIVIATQNPIEFHGTFPLPESQLDRFMISATMGYPDARDEMTILKTRNYSEQLDGLKPVLNAEEIVRLQRSVDTVSVGDDLLGYILEIVHTTRNSERISLGASPRAGLALKQAARANAICEGRDFVTPDDIKSVAVYVLAHRIIPSTVTASGSVGRLAYSRKIVRDILDEIRVPV